MVSQRPWRAGVLYGLLAFAAGFVLGTLRVLWITPAVGSVGAVSLELPVMLAVSYFLCRWLVLRWDIGASIGQRATMGATGFLLLMALEIVLAIYGFGQSPGQYLRGLTQPAGALGLLGQVAFGLLPVFVARAAAK
jgi:hypothetical protein